MMRRPNPLVLLAALLLPAITACTNPPARSNPNAHQAAINHVVLITLNNPEQADELLADNDLLTAIPSVRSFWAGTPLDIGRGSRIDGNYTVGLCVGFDDAEGYQVYLDAPEHVEYVRKWKPHWREVRIFDVITPN